MSEPRVYVPQITRFISTEKVAVSPALKEVKSIGKIETNDDDAYLALCIEQAMETAQDYLHRSFNDDVYESDYDIDRYADADSRLFISIAPVKSVRAAGVDRTVYTFSDRFFSFVKYSTTWGIGKQTITIRNDGAALLAKMKLTVISIALAYFKYREIQLQAVLNANPVIAGRMEKYIKDIA